MRKSWIHIMIGCLVVIQGIWWYRAVVDEGLALDHDVAQRLGRLARALEQETACFELYGSKEIAQGETFYLLAPFGAGPAEVDTLVTYFVPRTGGDTLAEHGHLSFDAPARVDVILRFDYPIPGNEVPNDSLTAMQRSILQVVGNSITMGSSGKRYAVLDTAVLAGWVDSELRYGPFNDVAYVVSDTARRAVYFSSHADLTSEVLESGANHVLFPGRRHVPPLLLTVHYPHRKAVILRSLAPMMLTSLVLCATLWVLLTQYVRSIRAQRKLARMQLDLVGNVTHELNTPISNIKLALDTMRKNGDDDELTNEQLLDIVRAESERLRENIERILDLSFLEGGRLVLQSRIHDAHELLKGVIAGFQLRLTQVHGSLRTEFAATRPQVFVDSTYFSNVFYNLIDNAIKYAGAGVDILIRTEDREHEVLFEVIDNGPGIDREEHALVFEKFYRVNVPDRYAVKGTGTGLFSVKRIIELHHGRISIIQRDGPGTCFRIHLPRAGSEEHAPADRRG